MNSSVNPAFVVTTYTRHMELHCWILYVKGDAEFNRQICCAVLKDDVIISHFPRVLSQICSLFIARGGAITCVVNGARRYFLKED